MTTDWLSLILYISTTILSAFAGTSVAFHLERRKKEDDESKKNLSAGIRAIFLISQQYNVLYSFKKQLIEPHRNDPGVWINMPASLPQTHDDLRFDVAALQFLLTSENPGLLGELLLEEQRFFEAIKAVNERSILHRDRLQSAVEALKLQRGDYVLSSQIEDALGASIVGGLKTLTIAIIEHTDEGMAGLKNVHAKLIDQLGKIFPGERILRFEFPADFS